MAVIPGRYGGYGVRPPRPGSARRMVEPLPESWKNTFARAEKALVEPFDGVTTDGQVVPGLFALQQTGISTRPLKDAADAFIASLTAAQKKVALHPMDFAGVAEVGQLGAICAALRGTDTFTAFASGTTEVTEGVLGTLDTSLLLNDLYDIRLTAEDAHGRATSKSATSA